MTKHYRVKWYGFNFPYLFRSVHAKHESVSVKLYNENGAEFSSSTYTDIADLTDFSNGVSELEGL